MLFCAHSMKIIIIVINAKHQKIKVTYCLSAKYFRNECCLENEKLFKFEKEIDLIKRCKWWKIGRAKFITFAVVIKFHDYYSAWKKEINSERAFMNEHRVDENDKKLVDGASKFDSYWIYLMMIENTLYMSFQFCLYIWVRMVSF